MTPSHSPSLHLPQQGVPVFTYNPPPPFPALNWNALGCGTPICSTPSILQGPQGRLRSQSHQRMHFSLTSLLLRVSGFPMASSERPWLSACLGLLPDLGSATSPTHARIQPIVDVLLPCYCSTLNSWRSDAAQGVYAVSFIPCIF